MDFLLDIYFSGPLFFKTNSAGCDTMLAGIDKRSNRCGVDSFIVGQIGFTPNVTAGTDTTFVDQVCGFHNMGRLMFYRFILLSDRLVLHQMPRQTLTQSCRSDLWFPQHETADLFIDSFIVGQIGVPLNATADIHTFMSIRFVDSTK